MKPSKRFTTWNTLEPSDLEPKAPNDNLEPVERTPEQIANDILSLEEGETFCEDAHANVYSAVYGILRKEKLQEFLSYKDGKICYVKN